MKWNYALGAMMTAGLVWGQPAPQPAPFPPQAPQSPQAAQAAAQAERQAAQVDAARQARDVAREIQSRVSAQVRVNGGVDFNFDFDGGNDYQSGQRALDRRQYEQALQRFDKVIVAKDTRTDGALYWKAYALLKLGRRDPALAALADLEKQFPQSRWLNDARALAVEVRAASGQPVSPESQADEEIKLLAINSLVHQEPDRAMPLLEKVLSDAKNPPSLKRRALYVLAQSNTPRAQEILKQYARGSSNPDLQLTAIQYLGTNRSGDNTQALAELYAANNDLPVRREIIQSLRRANAAKLMVDLVRKESNLDLKRELVQQLSTMKNKEATDYMTEILTK